MSPGLASFLGILIVAPVLSACSPTGPSQARRLPELPRLRPESFAAAVRKQVNEAYEQAQANPNQAKANGQLGMILHAYQQYDVAASCYERAQLLEPETFRWAYYLAVVQGAVGKNEKAAALLRHALLLQSDYLPAQLRMADYLYGSGRFRESREICERAVKEHPESPLAHYGLGRARSALGETGVESFRRACELAPDFAAAHYALALAYRDLADAAKSREHFTLYQRNRKKPRTEDPLLEAVNQLSLGPQHHFDEGRRLEAEGKIDQAVAEYERALEAEPDLTQAHLNLIPLFAALGQWQKAEIHYRAAIEINPSLPESHYNFGVLLSRQGKFSAAADAFRKAISTNPLYPEAHNNLGYLLEREGRWEEAIKHYQVAIDNKPDYRQARFNLARVLVSRGRVEPAIAELLHTLTPEDENTPTFLYALAGAYARAGILEKATHYFKEARRLAAALGQNDLASSIEKDQKRMNEGVR